MTGGDDINGMKVSVTLLSQLIGCSVMIELGV